MSKIENIYTHGFHCRQVFLIPSGEGFMSEGTYNAFQGSSVLWHSMSMAKNQGLRKFERWNQEQYSHSKRLKCNNG